jgi:uncharacterized protein YabE (DUF348 family)
MRKISELLEGLRRPGWLERFHIGSWHPHAIPVITFAALFILSLAGFGADKLLNHNEPVHRDAKIVIISHDGVRQTVPSNDATVGTLLKKLDITLNEGDVVEPAKAAPIDQDQFRINIYRAVPVQIVDGGNVKYTFSAATTPRSIAAQSSVQTYSEDIVKDKPAEDFVATGAIGKRVVIDRATPVNVNLYGTQLTMRTHATTVRQLLAEKHIKLLPQDQVKPTIDTSLAAVGDSLSVVRNGLSTVTRQEDVPAPTQTITDASLAYGTSALRQAGLPGKRAVTYQINTQNGVEVSRTVIQTVAITEPVPQIVVTGTNLSGIKGDMALAGIAPGDYQYADYIISRESGWCPTKAQGQYGGCPPYSGYVPASGGYGLCQSTPGGKMASAGADWATNPVTQLRWCSGYAHSRYGSWGAAYSHWVSYHNW